ncbi:MAG: hypothetical protein IPJ32_20960 [Sphingobacteriaceae bacterium]|nr:hypothetical protein [Sphingobacteriaceae bacterium]
MKKLIILSLLALLVFTNCGRKKHTAKKAKEERIEIVPFYRNSVDVQDLHRIDTNMYLVEPEEFLNKQQYENFKNAMWQIIRNPKSKVFNGSDQLCTADVLRDRVVYCDSVVNVDSLDNRIGAPYWLCDSTSVMDNLSRVEFYESWYLNTKTNLIEKETLGYAVWQYVKDKEAFREIFVVFRDDEAREKCKKYYFSY